MSRLHYFYLILIVFLCSCWDVCSFLLPINHPTILATPTKTSSSLFATVVEDDDGIMSQTTTSTTTAAAATTTTTMFNGGKAGAEADDSCLWDDTTMSGPLGSFVDELFLNQFRIALATSNCKFSSDYAPGYDGMMEIVKEMMENAISADMVVAKSRATLNSLFPNLPPTFGLSDRVGLLFWFEVLFAKPFPIFSCKLNSWVTWWAAQWLMGPCELQDLVEENKSDATTEIILSTTTKEQQQQQHEQEFLLDNNNNNILGDGKGQLVLVRRCRYLEAGSCASLCVNSCKLPTQQFFNEDMGVPMRMIPNYNTFECRLEFGVKPTLEDEEEARNVSCFSQCTSTKKRTGEQRMRVSCGSSSSSSTKQ